MEKVSRHSLPLAAVCVLALATAASSQAARGPGWVQAESARSSGAQPAKPAPQARGNLTRQFVRKWGNYVQRVYGVPVGVWAKRMMPSFIAADATNFGNALKRDTFEGAMAELAGTGHRNSDDAVITKLAASGDGTQTLGELANDLVYTPIEPCRILDTRSTGAGAIPADSVRAFDAVNAIDFTSQGGSATNCGTLGLSAAAVAVNLAAVSPSGAGFATVYPFGTTRPFASSINYAAGDIVNNALIIQIPNPLDVADFNIYTFAQSHYVGDIVGYFAAPVATALQCVGTTTNSQGVIAGASGSVSPPACPGGYTRTSTNCRTNSIDLPLQASLDGICSSARNNTDRDFQILSSAVCCRVPGR